ncbi:unnamed protein product [Sphagnum tenellum]
MTGEDDSPLYYPYACSGSVEYVHQECLLEWLNHSNARRCEASIFLVNEPKVCFKQRSISVLYILLCNLQNDYFKCFYA